MFLLGAVFVIYVALGYYATRVLDAAAHEGAVLAAGTGDPELGSAHADRLIAESAGGLVSAWSVSSSVEVGPEGRARVVVSVQAEVVGPIGSWGVTAGGSALVEDFIPQDRRGST